MQPKPGDYRRTRSSLLQLSEREGSQHKRARLTPHGGVCLELQPLTTSAGRGSEDGRACRLVSGRR